MQDYQFQYTKKKASLIVFLACFVAPMIAIYITEILLKLPEVATFIIATITIISLYQLLKKNTFGTCNAKITDTKVEFDFENTSRIIEFNDIISFKAYYGNKATILYLKNATDNFKLYANNFCDRKGFGSFCEDMIIQLDKYKSTVNPNVIHEGSVFATKGMLYFLSIATFIYLLAFFVENKEARLYIGICGGFYLLVMWTGYFNKRDLKSK